MNISRIGITAVVVGVVAIAAAFLSPWIIRTISPPKPLEVEVVDFATRVKNAAVAKVKGQAYESPARPRTAGHYVAPAVIGLGLLGMSLGVVSLLRDERKLPGGIAVGLGLGAAVVQWSIIISSIILFLILAAIVLKAFHIDLPG